MRKRGSPGGRRKGRGEGERGRKEGQDWERGSGKERKRVSLSGGSRVEGSRASSGGGQGQFPSNWKRAACWRLTWQHLLDLHRVWWLAMWSLCFPLPASHLQPIVRCRSSHCGLSQIVSTMKVETAPPSFGARVCLLFTGLIIQKHSYFSRSPFQYLKSPLQQDEVFKLKTCPVNALGMNK